MNEIAKQYHQEIVGEMQQIAGKKPDGIDLSRYLGSSDFMYYLTVPQTLKIARHFAKKHKDISFDDFVDLLTLLYRGKSHEERCIGGKLLLLFPEHRKEVAPATVSQWLDMLEGWNQVDSLCQNIFPYDQMLDRWGEWQSFLRSLSVDPNVNRRRASLVLLTRPLTISQNAKITGVAFENIEKLKKEKGNVLITKAISWLLRSISIRQPEKVRIYILENKKSLPSIAVRETMKKLDTGKKN